MIKIGIVLLCGLSILGAFTLDTSSVEEGVEIKKPDGFPLWFQSDSSRYYDTLTISVPAVVVDTVRVDFDIQLLCTNAHVTKEIRSKSDELAVMLRTLLLAAEREGFSVSPYEQKLLISLNETLKKGRVLRLTLAQKSIH